MGEKIDFVITWVNGNDKKWQKIKKEYTEKDKTNDNSAQRYRDYGSLKYLLRSIEKYSPWVNKVYLITDRQVPKWLNIDYSKIKVIDHTEIIEKQYLPTFNSNAIEWNIDKIPELEEKFVYFNDDMLLNAEVRPEDFFETDLPKDFKIYNSIIPKQSFDHILCSNLILINKRFKNSNKKRLFNVKYGWQQMRNFLLLPQLFRGIPGYLDPHGPLSLNKSSFKKVHQIWSKEINETIRHKFRKYNDISIWLVRYFQLETGKFKPRSASFNKYYEMDEIEKIKKDLKKKISNTMCINDTKIENFNEVSDRLVDILEQKFKNKSKFER